MRSPLAFRSTHGTRYEERKECGERADTRALGINSGNSVIGDAGQRIGRREEGRAQVIGSSQAVIPAVMAVGCERLLQCMGIAKW